MTLTFTLKDEEATVALGTALANTVQQELSQGIIVYLNGDLGAGKTTLTRGFVRGMGHKGNVKSPTYTLVEPYDLGDWQVYHFDLYRLNSEEEAYDMGIDEYFYSGNWCFIEWPEKTPNLIPIDHASIHMKITDKGERELRLAN